MAVFLLRTSLSLGLTLGGGHKFRADRIFYRARQNTVDMCQVIGAQTPAKRLLITVLLLGPTRPPERDSRALIQHPAQRQRQY